MRNKQKYFILTIYFIINFFNFSAAQDEFKFNITEIEIVEMVIWLLVLNMEKLKPMMDL